jgi:outer membrane protein assembly factor BamB
MNFSFITRWVRLGAAACFFAALTGCALITGDDGRYKPSALTTYPAGLAVQVGWKIQIGSGSGIGFAPAIVGSAVYGAASNGAVGKYDLSNGSVLWTTKLDLRLTAGVGSDGKTTAVVARDGTVIALDDTGAVKWRSRATSDVSVPPVVGYGVVVVRSGDYRIQAFNAETGDRIWNVQRPGPALALRAPARIALFDGLIITGIPGGKLIAINAVSGDVQWEGIVASPKGATDLERVNDVVGLPVIAPPMLCAVAFQGRILCFDLASGGRPIWSKNFSSAVGLTIDANQAYSPNQSDAVSAFALKDGKLNWTQDALRYRQLTSPAVLGSAVAVGDYDGYVHFMAADDGRLLARIAVGGGKITAPLIATPQGVLVKTGDGSLVLLVLK